MNAKKIMGAVLVALLAAALFIGAGAAAGTGETVFLYQANTGLNATAFGTWTNVADGTTLGFNAQGDIISGTPGKYQNKTGDGAAVVYLKNPTGAVEAYLKDGPTLVASVINGNVVKGSLINITSIVDAEVSASLVFIDPNEVPRNETQLNSVYANAWTNGDLNTTKLPTGKWGIQVVLATGGDNMSTITPASLLKGPVYYFTIISETENTVTLSADSVVSGQYFTATFTGAPGKELNLTLTNVALVQNQTGVVDADTVLLNNEGTVTVTLVAGKAGTTGKIQAGEAKASVTITEATITAEADKESYYVGEEAKLTGTSDGIKTLYVYMEGTNFPFYYQDKFSPITVAADGTWELDVTLKEYTDGSNVKHLFDAGVYSVYISGDPYVAQKKASDLNDYAVVSIKLTQPFLTAELQNSIVALGSDLVVTGDAESTDDLLYYIFGTNYFDWGIASVDEDTATYELEIDVKDYGMTAGQYFMVVQHPMYDGNYNIGPNVKQAKWNASSEEYDYPDFLYEIIQNNTANVLNSDGKVLFEVNLRQTSNAAEALCKALDTQEIDDMYVKLSFIVAGPMATMNPVPAEVTKGTQLTVSGETNMAPGSTISVQMASTAFTAVPKDAVNSASFISLTTKVQDDGTWEVTFDTTGLNIDEYTISATAGEFVSTAKVNVIEGAPEQPDQPDVPGDEPEQPGDEPEAPATPGFGALAALAGLGAVAVLLLRRE